MDVWTHLPTPLPPKAQPDTHPWLLQASSQLVELCGSCKSDSAEVTCREVRPPLSLLFSSPLKIRPSQQACLGNRQHDAMPRCCIGPLAEPSSGVQILAGKDLLWQGNLPQSLKAFTQDELEQALLQGSSARDGEVEGTGELRLDGPDSSLVG